MKVYIYMDLQSAMVAIVLFLILFNSLIPKSVLGAGTNNSLSEGFWLAKHNHKNILTMMELFFPPVAWF